MDDYPRAWNRVEVQENAVMTTLDAKTEKFSF